MHVALIHDAVIPPLKYGGTERIVAWLARALNRLGHRTTLIARPGSAVEGSRFIPIQPDWESVVPSDVDLLHLWGTPGLPPKKAYVVTIQGNGRPGETFHRNTIFISRRHAENHGSTHFVHNGIDPDDYACDEKREDYAVFLAKASWSVKNLSGAIDVARRAGMRLEVLGSRDWPLGLQRLLPPIGGVRYHGMADDPCKREILRRARALLFPVRWHEPFGIAITEALASGCAVVGTPYGSLPEIVTPEVGTLSASASELAKALSVPRFSPKRCRERVSQGFTHLDMARSYVRYYEHVLAKGTIAADAPEAPRTRDGFVSQELLPWND
jgi:glycosyltransferase involved in cell wall biosynthesis